MPSQPRSRGLRGFDQCCFVVAPFSVHVRATLKKLSQHSHRAGFCGFNGAPAPRKRLSP